MVIAKKENRVSDVEVLKSIFAGVVLTVNNEESLKPDDRVAGFTYRTISLHPSKGCFFLMSDDNIIHGRLYSGAEADSLDQELLT